MTQPTRPPHIAFLPGASGRGEFWEPVAALLPDAERHFFDWPGFGDVPLHPHRQLACFDDLATMVIERLTEPTVLVGQSMGGVVAAMVVQRRPDLVSHLVLAVTSAGIDVESLGAVDWRPTSRLANPHNPPWMWDERPDTTKTLAELPVPALLVWATDDEISPLAVGRYLDHLIPNSRLVVIADDDHWVARIHADQVAGEIRRFIGQGHGRGLAA